MKKIIKKNQVVIAALTVLLGVAGYINFSGNIKEPKDASKDTESAFANTDPVDVADGEIILDGDDLEEHIELNSDEDQIGEAVLTSTNPAATNMINIKLSREQTRSKAKDNLLEIINGDGMDEVAVSDATNAYIKMTEDMEKETEAETVLSAKGYTNCIVSIGDGSVDVIICAESITDEQRAQIEDVVIRKTGCTIDEINITLSNN